jgi:hypothetical protein
VDFHFESSVVPLLSPRAAPSDTYRIWKRGANLRADTTLAGFDGLRIRRADHSFLFFGEETDAGGRLLPPGSLLVLHRGKREVHDAFAVAAAAGDEDAATSDAAAYRPGLNITSARRGSFREQCRCGRRWITSGSGRRGSPDSTQSSLALTFS